MLEILGVFFLQWSDNIIDLVSQVNYMILIISYTSWLAVVVYWKVFVNVNTCRGKVLEKSWKGPWKVLEFQAPGRGRTLKIGDQNWQQPAENPRLAKNVTGVVSVTSNESFLVARVSLSAVHCHKLSCRSQCSGCSVTSRWITFKWRSC